MKKRNRDKIDEQKRYFLALKNESERTVQKQQSDDYLLRRDAQEKIAQEQIEKVKQLESIEKYMIEKLGKTQLN